MMKYIHTVLFILISLWTSGQGLLDPEGRWTVFELHCFPWGNSYSSSTLKLSGDTVIDNLTYQKFWISADENQQEWDFHGGLIRETEEGQVYYKRFFEVGEGLVYDFSAEEGDTLEIYNSQIMFDPVSMIVMSVDSVLTNDGYHKRLYLESPEFSGGETWIEGIGSIYGIINSCLGIFGGACGNYELLCYEQDGELIYRHEDFTACYVSTVGVLEPMFEADEFRLFPNPAKVYITIKLPVEGEKTIYIYDFFGQMVYVTKTPEENLNLDVSEFANGTYFIHIKDSHGNTHHDKIIIQ